MAISKKIASKKKATKPKMVRTQFEEGEYEYAHGGHVSKGEMVWGKLTQSKKADFLYKNFTPEITPASQETLSKRAYKFLPKNVKSKIESVYANAEEYAHGGVFNALDLPITYRLINNKGETIFKTNSFNKAVDTRNIKGFEGKGKLKIIATDKSGNQKTIVEGFDENGKEYAKGGSMYRKGGVMGDIYSIQNAKQFQQLITTYNELSERFGVVNYFLDHNDNSVVFLMHDEDSINTMELQKYVNSLSQKGFDIFDKSKNKNIVISKDNSQGGGYVYFKLKLSEIVQYAKGGGVDATKLSDKERLELKVLEGLSSFNNGLNLNGLLEVVGLSNYRFNKYANQKEISKVKSVLSSLIKKGYVEELGLGYTITQEGADYRRTFDYGTYANGGGVSSKEAKAMKQLEKHIKYNFVNTDMGSGWKFYLDNFDLEMRYLDTFDAEGIEDYDSLSKEDKKYYYDEWKEDLWQSSYDQFKKLAFEKYGYYYMEDGGNMPNYFCYEIGGL